MEQIILWMAGAFGVPLVNALKTRKAKGSFIAQPSAVARRSAQQADEANPTIAGWTAES